MWPVMQLLLLSPSISEKISKFAVATTPKDALSNIFNRSTGASLVGLCGRYFLVVCEDFKFINVGFSPLNVQCCSMLSVKHPKANNGQCRNLINK